MRVMITGANGFVGKNLVSHLSELDNIQVLAIGRESSDEELIQALIQADFIFHLAGVNRPVDESEFKSGNVDFTEKLCSLIREKCSGSQKRAPIVFSSSIQAELDNAYGASKRAAERAVFDLGKTTGTPVHVFRLPNVFGKWARPNYNSVVATFCYNISHGLPIKVDDPSAELNLVYVDDVVKRFMQIMNGDKPCQDRNGFEQVQPVYRTTVGELAEVIHEFRNSRETLFTSRVGSGLTRALYSTYLSYLPTERFKYKVPMHVDKRGVFVEMLKTPDCGQFSYFTAAPGVTRGGHYHHSKTEKFLVISGVAKFRFRNIVTNEKYEITVSGDRAEIVETAPGWAHDITNVGSNELVCMLWANEVFDTDNPDTYSYAL